MTISRTVVRQIRVIIFSQPVRIIDQLLGRCSCLTGMTGSSHKLHRYLLPVKDPCITYNSVSFCDHVYSICHIRWSPDCQIHFLRCCTIDQALDCYLRTKLLASSCMIISEFRQQSIQSRWNLLAFPRITCRYGRSAARVHCEHVDVASGIRCRLLINTTVLALSGTIRLYLTG